MQPMSVRENRVAARFGLQSRTGSARLARCSLSPVLRGEGWGEGREAIGCKQRNLQTRIAHPSPLPSPRSTGEREKILAQSVTAVLESMEPRRLFANSIYAFPGADGHMLYQPQPLGDHIQDYSTAGYMGGTVPIPDVPIKATVSPVAGDDASTIQAAIRSEERRVGKECR